MMRAREQAVFNHGSRSRAIFTAYWARTADSLSKWKLSESGTLFAFLNRSWSIVSTLVFIWLVITQLTPQLQGFYYTFLSLLLLIQLADMGFGTVLTQFASHEWAHLGFDDRGDVVGPDQPKARFASLIRIAIKWYSLAAIIFSLVLGFGGHVFFSLQIDSRTVDWQAPWWILCAFAAAFLLLVPISSLLEATHQVAKCQRNQLVANVCGTIAGWTTLILGGELYAIPVLFALRAIIGHALNTAAALPILRLWSRAHPSDRLWRAEFWPQQWRIWVSWMAGFMVFQSFTPIAFQLAGATVAGQIGIMVQAFHAVNQLSSARLVNDQPRMGVLAAHKDYNGLRRLVRTATKQNLLLATPLAATAICTVFAIKTYFPEIGARFGDVGSFTIFVLVAIPIQISNVETAAIRFQKREPFIPPTVVTALIILAGNLILTKTLDAHLMPIVFALASIVVLLPWVHVVYLRNMVHSR